MQKARPHHRTEYDVLLVLHHFYLFRYRWDTLYVDSDITSKKSIHEVPDIIYDHSSVNWTIIFFFFFFSDPPMTAPAAAKSRRSLPLLLAARISSTLPAFLPPTRRIGSEVAPVRRNSRGVIISASSEKSRVLVRGLDLVVATMRSSLRSSTSKTAGRGRSLYVAMIFLISRARGEWI